MTLEDFSEYLKGKSFDEILHEGRKESAERIFSEAIVPLALLLSQELLKILLLPPAVETGTPASTERTR
ncbi:hypothetical protein [Thermoflexus hugenholtzii]|jgi:hypothetical protein|uniref:Uncharacterized protein n=1 Tax=Thermoflexus hugenholtzii JAD2 TaxID=877466 RepID=A0A212QTI5_9CHLR|nr:hypothetical protein [Thermoflexus hugenholtzii]SNB62856.1 hypothetical protein SAMN02746019_00006010 [Thermoflexus hugenholtzii JAD2]